MKHVLSLITLILIGVFAFQFSGVSAVATGPVSGEARITIVKKQPTLSPRAQLLKLKRSLAEVRAKIALLKVKMANLQKTIDQRLKRKLSVAAQKFQLESLMSQYNQAEQTASELQKKIEATASGVLNKI